VPLFLASNEDWPRFRWQFLKFGILFGFTMIGYFLFYKVALHFTSTGLSGRATGVDAQHIRDKLIWFWTDFIFYISQKITRPAFDFTPAQMTFAWILSATLALGGLLLAPSRQGRAVHVLTCLQRIIALPCLLMLGYLPLFAVPEFGANLTYLTGIQASILLAVFLGLRNILDFATKFDLKKQIEIGFAVLLFCIMAFSASGNLVRNYVIPNHNEYSFAKDIMCRADLSKIKRIHVVGQMNFSGVLSYPEALVKGVLNEVAPNLRPEITSSSIAAPEIIHPDILKRNAAVKSYYQIDPRWGYYVIKPDLTVQQKETLNHYFADQAEAVAALPNVLVIDLSKQHVCY
jgi:hypothetical protein